MTFKDELAAYRAANPQVAEAEVFVIDLNGMARGKLVPIAALDKLADGKMKLPSSTPGLDIFSEDVYAAGLAVQTGDPDGPLDAVPGTLGTMLWAVQPTAQVQVTIRLPDGRIAPFDPRNTLARVVERAASSGLRPFMALEQEFFLIDPSEPLPPLNPVTGERLVMGQVYDLDVGRAFAPVLAEIAEASQALGAKTEALVTEFGYGQFEVNLHHGDDPMAAADQVVALRRAIRGVARRHGIDATFMAKPYGDTTGSGLHLHLSLWDADGNNIFAGEDAPNPAMSHAIAGCLERMADAMLIFAPHLNSYRRFIPNSLAPAEAHWAFDHRGVAVRVPETSGAGARLEHRVAGADANPYLVVAAILAAALDGIERKAELPPTVSGELAPGMGGALPLEWRLAEEHFAASAFIADWLGRDVQHVYAAMKRQERERLLAKVTDVELDLYLRRA
ncbi:MAG: glutamine synthetase family protein [Pseudomonadota bacterium]